MHLNFNVPYGKKLLVKALVKRLLQRIGEKTLANVDMHRQSSIIN